ncbi:MAG: 30S ribosome-binding factor RbfA [Phycisphaerales bacterium]
MSVTAEKMAAHLRRAVQAVFDRGLNDPRVRGLVSVTRIELSPDFRDATVFVSIMPEEHAELTMHGVKAATGHIRSQVARRANLPRTPIMHFKHDIVMRREQDVLAAIARATAEDEAIARARDASRPGGAGVDGVNVDPATLAAFDAFLEETGAAPPPPKPVPGWDDEPASEPASDGGADVPQSKTGSERPHDTADGPATKQDDNDD